MLKRFATLVAAVLALGFTFGSMSSANAHGRYATYGGCCGPVAPVYVHHNSYKTINKYVHRVVNKTVNFIRPRPVFYINHLHVRTNVHVHTDIHVNRVGHIVDVPRFKHVVSYNTHYYYTSKTTVRCICGPHRSHC